LVCGMSGGARAAKRRACSSAQQALTACSGLHGCRWSQRSATLTAPVDRCGTLVARASGGAVRAALPPAWSACGQQRAASDDRAQGQRLTPGATDDSKYIIPQNRLAPPELCQHQNNVWECPGYHSTARGSHGHAAAAANVVLGAAAPAQRVQPVRLARQRLEVALLICHIAAEAPLDSLLQHGSTSIDPDALNERASTCSLQTAGGCVRQERVQASAVNGAPVSLAVDLRLCQS